MAPGTPAPQSQYEAARKQKIMENQKRMAELGIFEASRDLTLSQESNASQTPRSVVKKAPKQRESLLPQRASARMAARGKRPVYVDVEDKPFARAKRQVRGVSREAEYTPRVAVTPEAEESALRAACLLAQALERQGGSSPMAQEEGKKKEKKGGKGAKQHPVTVKAMKRSHVHGCFCLGLNKDFCRAHFPQSRSTVVLQVDSPQGTTHPEGEESEGRKRPRSQKQEVREEGSEEGGSEGEYKRLLGQRRAVMGGAYASGEGEWEAVYLPHKTGLSGGWRGFALDQELDAGDAVVFEKVQINTLKVHIFRAADFEDVTEVKAEDKASEGKKRRQS